MWFVSAVLKTMDWLAAAHLVFCDRLSRNRIQSSSNKRMIYFSPDKEKTVVLLLWADSRNTNTHDPCTCPGSTLLVSASWFLPWQGLAQDILSDLVEDACLGLCFDVHRAVKQGYFFLDDTDQESMRDFGEHEVILSPFTGGVKPFYFLFPATYTERYFIICLQFPEIVDQPGLDVFGQVYNQWKNKECVCPNCSRSIAASRFAPHLEKCLGMGRNSSRIANRR